jgi:hypothetical protein
MLELFTRVIVRAVTFSVLFMAIRSISRFVLGLFLYVYLYEIVLNYNLEFLIWKIQSKKYIKNRYSTKTNSQGVFDLVLKLELYCQRRRYMHKIRELE